MGWVDGGEGQYWVDESVPGLLDQPKQVSVDYILKNHPTLAGLPRSALEAMANNWQTAYSQLAQYSPKELRTADLPQGYTPAKIRNENGQLILSYGGPGEMVKQAADAITYSPEYGLVVPQQAIRAPEFKRGLGSYMPAIIAGATLGPLAGALGGGTLGAAGAGALTGGVTSAITGGDVLKGALTGGITGGLGAAASPIVGSALEAAGITGMSADVLKNAAISAGKAAIAGGDPLTAALSSAVGTGVAGTVVSLDIMKELDPNIAKALTAAAAGAASAAATGRDPVQSALMGIADYGMQSAINAMSGTPQATQIAQSDQATPSESWIDQGMLAYDPTDLMDVLARQEQEQRSMQAALEPTGTNLAATPAVGRGMSAALSGLPALLSGLGMGSSGAPAAQAAAGAQQGSDLGSLLALMSMSQQKQEPAQTPVVGEIKPYQFSTDLLSGLYGQNDRQKDLYQSNNDLLRMTRG